jgi:hypothetical protein
VCVCVCVCALSLSLSLFSRGPDRAISPAHDSDGDDKEVWAPRVGANTRHRGGGDALEEDLELAAMKTLALVDDD